MLWRATLAFGLGVVWADVHAVAFASATRVALVALVLWWASGTRRWFAEIAIFAAFVACGALALLGPLEMARRTPLDTPRSFVIEATVCGVGGSLERPEVELCRGVDAFTPSNPVPERLLLHTSGEPSERSAFDGLVSGYRIRAQIRLLPLRPAGNPGERDRRPGLERRGIAARAILEDAALLVRISSRDGFVMPGWASLAQAFRKERRRIAERLSGAGEGGALLCALVLGDRSGISADQRDHFASLGLSHLLAVSGLHVILVAGAAFGLAAVGFRRCVWVTRSGDARIAAVVLAACVAVAYGAIAGWGIPVRRALIFFGVVALAASTRRNVRPSQALPVAALALLVSEPHALFELSAQLSFAATGALLLAAPRPALDGVGLAGRVVGAVLGLLHTSATAIAATAPLLALHGLASGGAGLIANLIAVPWTTFVLLPASLAGALIAWLGEGVIAERVLGALVLLGQWSLDAVAGASEALPGWSSGGASGAAGFAVSLVAVVCTLRSRSYAGRVAGCVVVVATLQFGASTPIDPEPPRAVFLDVGQGDATLLQGRDAAVLVDGGRAIAGRFDQGERVVLPALRALGVTRLAVVVATHADVDHRGGLEAVLRRMPVGELWLPSNRRDDPGFAGLAALARARDVRVVGVASEDPVRRLGDLRLEVLWPPRDRLGQSRNDDSVVLRVSIESAGRMLGRILLAADIGKATEKALLERGGSLSAEVLKVGHHGSVGSSSGPWLDRVAAQHAIVSAPCHGRAGLPSPVAIERVAAAGAQIHWTGEVGAVFVAFPLHPGVPAIRYWADRRACSILRSSQ